MWGGMDRSHRCRRGASGGGVSGAPLPGGGRCTLTHPFELRIPEPVRLRSDRDRQVSRGGGGGRAHRGSGRGVSSTGATSLALLDRLRAGRAQSLHLLQLHGRPLQELHPLERGGHAHRERVVQAAAASHGRVHRVGLTAQGKKIDGRRAQALDTVSEQQREPRLSSTGRCARWCECIELIDDQHARRRPASCMQLRVDVHLGEGGLTRLYQGQPANAPAIARLHAVHQRRLATARGAVQQRPSTAAS